MSLWLLDNDAIRDAHNDVVIARTDWTNPLDHGGWASSAMPGITVGWSGWFNSDPEDDDATRAIRAQLRSWTAGTDDFRRVCDRLEAPLRAAGSIVCLRPRVGHVLSDVPTCVKFFKERAGRPWRLLLDPSGLLTREMAGDAEDHLRRIIDALGGLAWALLLTNVIDDGTAERPQSPVHRGIISVAHLREAADRFAGPRVLLRDDLDAQRAAIGV
ncbi:MAG: hypothetical protein ACKVW3_10845 [Phycisphaerales bacterium]